MTHKAGRLTYNQCKAFRRHGIHALRIAQGTRLVKLPEMHFGSFDHDLLSTPIPQSIFDAMPKHGISISTGKLLPFRHTDEWISKQQRKRIRRVHLLRQRRIPATYICDGYMEICVRPNYRRRDHRLEIVKWSKT